MYSLISIGAPNRNCRSEVNPPDLPPASSASSSHLARMALSLQAFLKLSCRFSKRQIVVWLNSEPCTAARASPTLVCVYPGIKTKQMEILYATGAFRDLKSPPVSLSIPSKGSFSSDVPHSYAITVFRKHTQPGSSQMFLDSKNGVPEK